MKYASLEWRNGELWIVPYLHICAVNGTVTPCLAIGTLTCAGQDRENTPMYDTDLIALCGPDGQPIGYYPASEAVAIWSLHIEGLTVADAPTQEEPAPCRPPTP
jgi:hypothetical protein